MCLAGVRLGPSYLIFYRNANLMWKACSLRCGCRVRSPFCICCTSDRLILFLYRIRPNSTIPICLDLGTNTQEFLDDPLYLGLRQKRVSSDVMTEFMEEFMDEMTTTFPKLLVQFEDFSTDNAFLYLEKFRNKYPVFNDDVLCHLPYT